jgi:hypothetical protein
MKITEANASTKHSTLAEGPGTRGTSWMAPSRCGVRGEPWGGRAPVVVDWVRGLSRAGLPHHPVPQPAPALTPSSPRHNRSLCLRYTHLLVRFRLPLRSPVFTLSYLLT